MRVLFTGGGTGGHIMPVVAVAEKVRELLKASGQEANFLFIGSTSPFNEVIEKAEIPIKIINAYKVRRYFSINSFTDFINFPIGIIQSLIYVFSFMPDVVFSKGGYASFPVVFAAWLFRIPVVIHESDIIPGLANSVEAKMANRIAISFPETAKSFPAKKVFITGNPIRSMFYLGDRERGLREFGLRGDLPVVLILGGSQGARRINDITLEALTKLCTRYQVIHVCGAGNFEDIKKTITDFNLTNLDNYRLYSFLSDNINDAYAVSDLVVSRAGANNIAEIINLNKPVILVPLSSSAGGHQMKNAYYYSSKGAALLLDETNMTPNMLYDAVFGILDNKSKQVQMIRAARQLMSTDAPRLIAEEIIRLGK